MTARASTSESGVSWAGTGRSPAEAATTREDRLSAGAITARTAATASAGTHAFIPIPSKVYGLYVGREAPIYLAYGPVRRWLTMAAMRRNWGIFGAAFLLLATTAATQQPATGSAQPATSSGQPATSSRQPATSSGQPATSSGQRSTGPGQPSTASGQSSTSSGQAGPKLTIPVAVSTVVANPDRYAGSMVSMTAAVVQLYGATAFSVSQARSSTAPRSGSSTARGSAHAAQD